MKRCNIILLLMLLLFASCTENKEAKELFVRVDSLMDEYPDSALAMLDSAYSHKGEWRKSQQMRYELLRAKAQNKAYVDFTTDSIMKEVVEYYDAHGTANEQMEAHYLLGCTYRDLHESPMALSCYLDATEKADTLSDDCDYGTLMRIWGQVADEYDRQVMPYKELDANENFKKCALKNKDTINYIIGIEHGRKVYFALNDTMNAINTAEKAYKLYLKNGYKQQAIKSLLPLIYFYIEKQNISRASYLLNSYESYYKYVDKSSNETGRTNLYYRIKAKYYLLTNKVDSADINYRLLLKAGDDFHAYSGLVDVFMEKDMNDSIYKYSKLKEKAFSKEYTYLHTQAMFNAEGMFNYSRNQSLALEKAIEMEHARIRFVLFIISLSLLIFITIFLFDRYNTRKNKELQHVYSLYHEKENEYQKAIADFTLMESDFEKYKILKAKEIEKLNDSKHKAAEAYEKTNRKEILSTLCSTSLVKNILQNEKICHDHRSNISKEQWDELYKLLEEAVPILYTSYIIDQRLSERERKTLILTCLGINTKNVGILLNMTPSNISNIKMSINKKIFSDSSGKTLYSNIIFA